MLTGFIGYPQMITNPEDKPVGPDDPGFAAGRPRLAQADGLPDAVSNLPISASGQQCLALLVEYDGTAFHGWQSQAMDRTVQQVLQQALRELTAEGDLQLHGCSRTDAGVHARGHVSHFLTACKIPPARLPLALNSRLPADVTVLAATVVPDDFHARFHTVGKVYAYRYWLHPSRPALARHRVCHIHSPVDVLAMQAAARHFLGTHDFTALMDMGSPAHSPVRTIERIDIRPDGSLLTLLVQGDGFLYHMVRILAGTLLYVGLGKLNADDIPVILASRDRRRAGKTMPPQGLCLESVFYQPALFGMAPDTLQSTIHQAALF